MGRLWTTIKVNIVLALMIMSGMAVINAQDDAPNVKSWIQTSVEDFSNGVLNNTIVRNASGGEIELLHPMSKVVEDHKDNSIPRFASRDSEGAYIQVWIETDGVYARRYNVNGVPLGDNFQVSDIHIHEERTEVYYKCPSARACAVSNPAGGFLIVWDCSISGPYHHPDPEYRIYGRLYNSQGKPLGSSFGIDEGVGRYSYYPTAFVDQSGIFWVLWSEQFFNPQKCIYLYAQRYTDNGQKIGRNFKLIEEEVGSSQLFAATSVAPDGSFAVAWKGEGHDFVVQWFDSEGRASGSAVRINASDSAIKSGSQQLWRPDLCFDTQGTLLVAWGLNINPPIFKGDYGNIYGQYFRDRSPYGSSFLIKERSPYAPYPDVFLGDDGSFRVSWTGGTDIYVNGWQWSPVDSGTFISEVFDTGPAGADFEKISWALEEMPETTVVKFKIRTGADLENLGQSDWYGHKGGSENYTYSGQSINPLHNGDRFIQYKAFLSTLDERRTPILYDISITYTSRDTVTPATPENLTAIPGHSMVTLNWKPNSETDLLEYRLYRRTEEETYDSTWTRHLPPSQTTCTDSSAETGTIYFYAISAVDSSLNESRASDEVSVTPFGESWYVDVSGSGAGDGSILDPFLHIKDALELAIYGDTVHVVQGTYTESISVGRGITLLGEGRDVCRILNPEDQDHWWPPVVVLSDGSVIKGFTVHQRFGKGASAIKCGEGSASISDNKIMANWNAQAISSQNASPIISDNLITTAEYGIFSRGGFPLILRNMISDARLGICTKSGSGSSLPSRSRIQNNIIYDVNQGIFASWDTQVEIVNNTIYLAEDADGGAIRKAGGSVKIMNNIIVNKGRGWTVGVHQCSFELSYNDIWGAYADYDPGEGDISLDPLFVNVDKGDFRLRSDSPCRDAGNPDPAWNDLDGTRNDMGAYGGPDPIRIRTYHPKVAVIVPPASGAAGDTLTIPIQLDNAAGLAEAVIKLSYDPDLLLPVRVKATELTSAFSLAYHFDVSGMARITLSSEAELESGQGAIVEIVFAVPTLVSGGDACPLKLKEILLSDGAGVPIEIKSLTDGAFVVIERGPSDKFIYVDQSYSGEEDGSWSRPFDTIEEAMVLASAGDTIQVAAGIYREWIMMKEGVFLRGSGPLVSKIYVEGDALDMAAVTFHNVSNGGISGFEIRRRSSMFEGPTLECITSSPLIAHNRIVSCEGIGSINSAICCQGTTASRARIEDNLIEVSGIGGTGIWCYVSDPIIAGNRLLVGIGDFEGMGATGIFCESSDPLIINNQIRLGEEATGIQCLNSSHPIIANNYLEGNTQIQFQWAIRGNDSSSLLVINNIIRGFETAILSDSWNAPSSALVENNIIWDNKIGVKCDQNSSIQSSYNLFWNNKMDYLGCSPREGNMNADPMFIDPMAGDFHLKMGSPCIDAGDPDPKYNDLDGSRNDMGIYGGPHAEPSKVAFPLPTILSLPDTSASPGDTLSVPINAVNASGIAEVKIVLSYPPQTLSVFDVQTTAQSRTFSLTTENLGNGQTQILMSSTSGIEVSSCPLVYLSVAIDSSAGTGSQIGIEFGDVALRDELAGDVLVLKKLSGFIKIETPTAVKTDDDSHSVPSILALLPNYPNPLNSLTVIPFIVPFSSPKVKLTIYNPLGQKIRTLVDGEVQSGEHRVIWDSKDDLGRDVSSGVYFYQLTVDVGKWTETKKMLLLR